MSNASTNQPPVEQSHGGSGRKLSDTIPMEAVQRIAKLPVVESSLNIATDMYSRMKESSSMMNWTLSTAESTVNKAVEHAIPVAEKMEKHLKRMDSLLCSSLDYVEAKVPAVKLPPAEILESTSKLVESKLQPALDRASELKQMGAEKMHLAQLMAFIARVWELLRPAQAPQPRTISILVTPSTPPNNSPMELYPCPPAPPPTPVLVPSPVDTPNSNTTEYHSLALEESDDTMFGDEPKSPEPEYKSCEIFDSMAISQPLV